MTVTTTRNSLASQYFSEDGEKAHCANRRTSVQSPRSYLKIKGTRAHVRWETEAGESSGAHRSARLVYSALNQRFCFKPGG